MYRTILIILALGLLATGAHAQSRSTSGSTSSSSSTSSPHQSQTATAANQLTYNVSNPAVTSDTANVNYRGLPQNTPDLMLGGYAGNASPDSCTGTRQFGVTVPGGSAGYGSPIPDQACRNLRAADYRMRFAQFESAYGLAHPGLAANMATAELHDIYEAHVDLCVAEGQSSVADCRRLAWSEVYPDKPYGG